MKLHELIEQCGDDVFFQNMDETTANIDYTMKGGIRAKIAVPGDLHDMVDVQGGWKRLGLVVWLPRDKVAEAMSATPPAAE